MIGMSQIIKIFRDANEIDYSIYDPNGPDLNLSNDDFLFLRSRFQYGPTKISENDPSLQSFSQHDDINIPNMEYFMYESGLSTPLADTAEPEFDKFQNLLIFYFFHLAKRSEGFCSEEEIKSVIGYHITDLGISRNEKEFYDIARTYWTLTSFIRLIFSGDNSRSASSEDVKFSNASQLLVELNLNIASIFFPTDATKGEGAKYLSESRRKELEQYKIPQSIRNQAIREVLEGVGMYTDEEIERVIKQNPNYYTDEPGCFIATAVYGSNNSPEVKLLRLWRDTFLLKRYFGRIFVKFYYKVSPYLAFVIEKNKLFKILFRYVIDRFLIAIKS